MGRKGGKKTNIQLSIVSSVDSSPPGQYFDDYAMAAVFTVGSYDTCGGGNENLSTLVITIISIRSLQLQKRL